MEKPHILYWKWNDEILQEGVLEEKVNDIMNRSMFDCIYISLHPMLPENRIMSNPKTVEKIRQCCDILNKNSRKMVLDLDISREVEYFMKDELKEKLYYAKYHTATLDTNGMYSMEKDDIDGIIKCWSADFNDKGCFFEKSVVDISSSVLVDESNILISPGEKFSGKK